MPIKPSRPKKRRVNFVRIVRRPDYHHPIPRRSSVEALQEGVDYLDRIIGIVTAKSISASNRVEFIDEDDTWRLFFGGLEV